jgi:hypothetical protein
MSEADGGPHANDSEWTVRRVTDGDVATALVLAIAEAQQVDPRELGFSLGRLVDPDAVNRLMESRAEDIDPVLSLTISGYEARIRPGEVRVRR